MQKTTTDEPSAAGPQPRKVGVIKPQRRDEHRATKPQPNRAKRMECAQLAAAFVSAPEFDRGGIGARPLAEGCAPTAWLRGAAPGCGSAALGSSVVELNRAGHRNNFKHFVK
jgi:hypothetical protein